MASNAAALERPAGAGWSRAGGGLARGFATAYLSLVVLLPLAALVWSARGGGLAEFWHQATEPEALAALKLTLGLAAACAAVNAVAGTADGLGARPRPLPRQGPR